MLRHDAALRVERAGLFEQSIGAVVISSETRFCRKLHKLRHTVLSGHNQGEYVVAIVRIQLDSTLKALQRGIKVSALHLLCAFEVRVVGLAGLPGGDLRTRWFFRLSGLRLRAQNAGRNACRYVCRSLRRRGRRRALQARLGIGRDT
jgi:hypothetical protein